MYQRLLKVRKEFLDTSDTGGLLVRHLFVTFGYATCFLVFYALSKNFFTHQGWSSWYMPTGVRLAAMLILPIRFWPTLLFTEFVCHRFITVYYGSFSLPPLLPALTKSAMIYMLYSCFTLPAKLWIKKVDLSNVKYCLLMLIALFGQCIVAATNLTFFVKFYNNVPFDRKAEIWLSFVTGGAIGGLLLAPLILGAYQFIQDKNYKVHSKAAYCLSGYAILLLATYNYLQNDPGSLYVVIALALMPVLMFAYSFGWQGALVATTLTNLFLAASVYGHSGTLTMQQIQLFVIVLNISALLFGAVISNQQALAASLQASNNQLQKLALHNQQLANRFINVQEHERKAVSQELHDDIGQIVTGLKSELKVMAATSKDEQVLQQLPRIQKATSAIYDSVYRLMHRLRPRLLDEHGLYNTLTSGELVIALHNAGINYRYDIQVELSDLQQDIQTTVFRVCQEAFTNVIKHSAATTCALSIHQQGNTLTIRIEDNGRKQSNTQHESGHFGLTGIEDRVSALNGNFDFELSVQGCCLNISLPV